jgi:hypothetical protein
VEVRVRTVARLMIAAAALTAAGCRQLFGIDDTHTRGTPDASDAGASDAGADASRAGSSCTVDHLLCVDFDSDATGLALLPDRATSALGTLTEIAVSDAPTPPRVLRAEIADGAGPATAFASVPYAPGELGASAITFDLQAGIVSGNPGCDALVFAVAWTDLNSMAANEAVTVSLHSGSILLGVTAGGATQTQMHPFPLGVWTSLALTIDTANGDVVLVVGGGAIEFPVDLSATGAEAAALGTGISVATDHGACQVSIDTLVVDRLQ